MITILLLLAGDFKDATDALQQARDAADRVRDAAIASANWTEDRGAEKIVKAALESVEAARAAVQKGVRSGDIGEETAAEMLRQIDRLKHEVERARDQIEQNLARIAPALPDPAGSGRESLAPAAAAPAGLTKAELEGFKAEIRSAIDRVTPYCYTADKTLDARFAEAGIKLSRGYAASWGSWIYVATHGTVNRHGAWAEAIDLMLLRVERGEAIDPRYADRLRREMSRWRSEAGFVQEMCEEMMRSSVMKGLACERSAECRAERWAYRITPEACERGCEGPRQRIALADEAYARAEAQVRDPNLLGAPIGYEAWKAGNVAPPVPAAAPARTEREEFRSEAERMARRLEERLEGHDSLLWDLPHVAGSATTFDSVYFGADLFTLFEFNGRTMIGGEVNYYYQGMFWSRVGVPPQVMYRIIDMWNALTGRPLGNRNQYYAAKRGSEDMDRAMAYPGGPEAYFASDAYVAPEITRTGDNPERVVPGNENRGLWP